MSKDVQIGVFICHCGTEIASILDVEKIEQSVKDFPNVSYVKRSLYPCSKSGVAELKKAISEQGLNRIVVAGCTPRTHEPLFRKVCQDAGLNPYLFEMVNIREQCARVHANQNGKATQKAIELIRMGVAKVAAAEPIEKIKTEIQPTALVIGAGITGMTAALSLANRGVTVKLIEKENKIGGVVRQLNKLYPDYEDAAKFIEEKIQAIEKNPKIETFLNSRVTSVSGHVGNFEVVINANDEEKTFSVGVIIVATGAKVFKPAGLFGYGKDPNVVTQLEFEALMRQGNLKVRDVVMIQCVGCEDEHRPNCSRVGFPTAIKNAILLKEKYPEVIITILFRGFTEYVKDLERVKDMGVLFIRYDPDKPPELKDGMVTVVNEKTEKTFQLPYDLVILSTPLIPQDETQELARMLKIPTDEQGFLLEPHIKLRPGNFCVDGIYVAGSAHVPASISECVAQGHGAASRAFTLIEAGFVEREPVIAAIDEDICRGCGRCAEVCAFQAIEILTHEDGLKRAHLNEFLCKGCGMCAVVCICGAASVVHLTDGQMEGALKVLEES